MNTALNSVSLRPEKIITMKKALFVALTILIAFSSCKNEGDANKSPNAGTEPEDPAREMFDSVKHAAQMEKKRKEAEANLITPENLAQKGPAGAFAVGKVENTSYEKNEALVTAVKSFLSSKSIALTQENGFYGYNLVDLNGDGAQDALVLLTGPFFCEYTNCTLLVAKGDASGKFTVHSMMRFLGAPITISESTTKGWRDIIAQVFDEENTGTTMKLAFDGAKYPDSPTASGVKPLDKAVMVTGYLMNAGNSGLNLTY